MKKDPLDVVCLGEALIDFVSEKKNVSLEDAPGFLNRFCFREEKC
jgi:hypothetical protein